MRVVALTSFAERKTVLDAIDAGAVGYILKDGEMEELLRATRAAARGESPLVASRRPGRAVGRAAPAPAPSSPTASAR